MATAKPIVFFSHSSRDRLAFHLTRQGRVAVLELKTDAGSFAEAGMADLIDALFDQRVLWRR